MRWNKKGILFEPNEEIPWCRTYAGPPFVEIYQDKYRVYFSGSDNDRISRIGFFTIDKDWNKDTIEIEKTPILDIGDMGCFDERGVAYPWIVNVSDNVKYLYYAGWIKGGGFSKFFTAIGLAISEDGGKTYSRVSRAPIFERTDEEPISTGSMCVRLENGIFKMWYTCIYNWEKSEKGSIVHHYTIRYAESNDGINWKRNIATSIIPTQINREVAIAKPCVIYEKDKQLYKMWYSYRGDAYKIGYAESENGIQFHRFDSNMQSFKFGKDGEWDHDMLAYAYVFEDNGEYTMLYNGNGYGKSGIGLAMLNKETSI